MAKRKDGDIDEPTGQSIRERIMVLKAMVPKRDGLLLYRTKADRKRSTRSATLYVYIRSDSNDYALHETFFRKRTVMSALQWQHFMKTMVLEGTGEEGTPAETLGILKGAIIPGVNVRSQKLWDVRAVIGFIMHDLHGSVRSTLSAGRHKAKSSGFKNGQTDLRRGHRNRARKAK